jgi:DNA recombination protein RmuC
MELTTLLVATMALAAGMLIGVALGYFVGWARGRVDSNQARVELAELQAERRADQEKLRWLDTAETKMREAFDALASHSLQTASDELLKRADEQIDSLLEQMRGDLKANKSDFKALVDPLKDDIVKLDLNVHDLETKREGAYRSLETELKGLAETHRGLMTTTLTLAQALRSPTVRGRWGEVQLRRVVELANMVNHVDFDEQAVGEMGRPDMVIHLSNQGILPVDAKVPMDAYLLAVEAADEETRRLKLLDHAKAMQSRVRDLAQKKYWDQFERSPDFVIMFIPNEACLSAAFDADPTLLDYALDQHVLIASPVTLLALLKAISYGWYQVQITENAKQIAELGAELYKRLEAFLDHYSDLGKSINKAADQYNKTLGSLQRRLIPSARRLQQAGLGTGEPVVPDTVDTLALPPSPPEDA